MRLVRQNRSDDGAVAGHAADSHIVGGAIHWGDFAHSARCRPGGAAQGYIARRKAAANVFAEDHGEVDRAATRRVGLADGLIDRDRRLGAVVGDGVIAAGGGNVGVARQVLRLVRQNRSDDGAVAGHAADSHIVGGAVHWGGFAHSTYCRSGGAAQGYIARRKAGTNVFAEDNSEVDRAAARRVRLADCLINRHGWSGSIVSNGVIAAGGGNVGVARQVLRLVRQNRSDDGAVAGHAADSHIVGGAVHWGGFAHSTYCRSGGAAQGYIARRKAATNVLAEDNSEVDRAAIGRIGLADCLINCHGWSGFVNCVLCAAGRLGIGLVGHIMRKTGVVSHSQFECAIAGACAGGDIPGGGWRSARLGDAGDGCAADRPARDEAEIAVRQTRHRFGKDNLPGDACILVGVGALTGQ